MRQLRFLWRSRPSRKVLSASQFKPWQGSASIYLTLSCTKPKSEEDAVRLQQELKDAFEAFSIESYASAEAIRIAAAQYFTQQLGRKVKVHAMYVIHS